MKTKSNELLHEEWWGKDGRALTNDAASAKEVSSISFQAGRQDVFNTTAFRQHYNSSQNREQRRLDDTALQLYVALLAGRGALYDSGELRTKSYELAKKLIAEGRKPENIIP